MRLYISNACVLVFMFSRINIMANMCSVFIELLPTICYRLILWVFVIIFSCNQKFLHFCIGRVRFARFRLATVACFFKYFWKSSVAPNKIDFYIFSFEIYLIQTREKLKFSVLLKQCSYYIKKQKSNWIHNHFCPIVHQSKLYLRLPIPFSYFAVDWIWFGFVFFLQN